LLLAVNLVRSGGLKSHAKQPQAMGEIKAVLLRKGVPWLTGF
jgi:hypothetical protein